MRKIMVFFSVLIGCTIAFGQGTEKVAKRESTFCNPMNLNYRFQSNYRKAADPAIIRYQDKYLLFASHSGGYWYSDDLMDWKFLAVESLPAIQKYAPGVITIKDTVYYVASSRMKDYVYYSTNPFKDNWKRYG